MVRVTKLETKQTKNRSSKHLIPLTGIKRAVRSMSNEALMKSTSAEAMEELTRRNRLHEPKKTK